MATYYVHATAGDDSASGQSPRDPWRTLSRVNAQAWSPGLLPGDTVLLNSSSSFDDGLYVDLTHSSGSSSVPITIQAYGDDSSVPVIRSKRKHAILLHAPAVGQAGLNFAIRRLHLMGNGELGQDGKPITGLLVYQENSGELAGLQAVDLVIEGFSHAGFQTMRRNDRCGFITDVKVQRVCSNNNPGHTGLLQWTGSGIVLGGVCRGVSFKLVLFTPASSYTLQIIMCCVQVCLLKLVWHFCAACERLTIPILPLVSLGILAGLQALALSVITLRALQSIQDCSSACNGQFNTNPGGGPVGIWAWDSREVVIERCVSSTNCSCANDGGGFDLDGGCTNCVIQDCTSMDNWGPGYLVSSYPHAAVTQHCVIHRNSSMRDNQGRKAASLYVWGGDSKSNIVQDIWFKDNVVQTIPGHDYFRVDRCAQRIYVD